MTNYPHMDQFRAEIEEWWAEGVALAEREGTDDPPRSDDWWAHDDAANDLLYSIGIYMGIIQADRVWTVDITRQYWEETGEAPFSYVVNADTFDEAISKAKKAHTKDDVPEDDPEGKKKVKVVGYYKGLPTHGGYWNDVRGEQL